MPRGRKPERNCNQIVSNKASNSGNRSDLGKDKKKPAQHDTYVDNSFNRKHNRVGLPLGTAVVSRPKKNNKVANPNSSPETIISDHESGAVGSTPDKNSSQSKRHVNNKQNRELGRVDMLHGEAVVHKNIDASFLLATQPEVKNAKSKTTRKIPKMLNIIEDGDDVSDYSFNVRGSNSCDPEFALIDSHGDGDVAFDQAMYRQNRCQEELSWERSAPTKGPPKTKYDFLADYKGKKIPYNELKLRRVIGRGAFGQVYFAKWQDMVVAVKKIQSEKISDARIRDLAVEVMKFCTLNHPNIVKFIGACVEKPDLCIVMEYMQMTLYDALYQNEDTEFSEDEKLQIIHQTTAGMKYLHNKRIAHCDLKTPNILMDYVKDEICEVKITDFGLSMIVYDTTVSVEELVHDIGTPQYSPPEMLRGDILSAKDMMKADVYSLAIVFLAVIFKAEPFPNYTFYQLKTEVGEEGNTPEIPMNPDIDESIKEIMEKAWSYEPTKRPRMLEIHAAVSDCKKIYNN